MQGSHVLPLLQNHRYGPPVGIRRILRLSQQDNFPELSGPSLECWFPELLSLPALLRLWKSCQGGSPNLPHQAQTSLPSSRRLIFDRAPSAWSWCLPHIHDHPEQLRPELCVLCRETQVMLQVRLVHAMG